MKEKFKKLITFVTNPRLLLCLLLAWMITNGWSYILFAVGTLLGIEWMTAVAGAYLAFLWLPVSPEKLVTLTIAIFLLRFLFPKDTQTLAVLRASLQKLKEVLSQRKAARKERKMRKKNGNMKAC